jgi:hypothetical protein
MEVLTETSLHWFCVSWGVMRCWKYIPYGSRICSGVMSTMDTRYIMDDVWWFNVVCPIPESHGCTIVLLALVTSATLCSIVKNTRVNRIHT